MKNPANTKDLHKIWKKMDLLLPAQYSFAKLYLKDTEPTKLQSIEKTRLETLLTYPKPSPDKFIKNFVDTLKKQKEDLLYHFLKVPARFADLFLETAPKRRTEILKLQKKFTTQFQTHIDYCSKDQIQMRKDIGRMYKLLDVLKEKDEDWNSQAPRQELIKLIETKEAALSPNSSWSTLRREGSIKLLTLQKELTVKIKELGFLSSLLVPICESNADCCDKFLQNYLADALEDKLSPKEIWDSIVENP